MKRRQSRFSLVLIEAVREGLNQIGPCISDATLVYLQKSAVIQSDSHSMDAAALDECFKNLFGCGAEIIERKILESLYSKLNVSYEIEDDFEFLVEMRKVHELFNSLDPSTIGFPSELEETSKPAR